MKPSGWIPLLVGVVLGLAGGLYYSWVVNPVEYVDTAPASLREDFRQEYLTLIAAAYAGTGDLDRARFRLAQLAEAEAAAALSQLAQTRLAKGRPESEARALAQLAAALGERPTPLPARTAERGTLSPSRPPPTATATLRPTLTPTPTATPGAPFQLVEKEKVCDPELPAPLIQVEVVDAAGRPVPGVEILVVWDTGQDHFFTGLKPDMGAGYADFVMQEGVYYSLQLVQAEEPVTGLIAEECVGEEGETFPGSWLLTFQQPEPP